MTDPLRKRRDVDEAGRQREVDAGLPVGPQVEGSVGAVRSLQQTAGNAAVASLLGGSSGAVTAGPQRAPVKPGDELMKPGEEAGTATATAAPAPAPTPAAATPAGSGQPAAAPAESSSFEASLFEQSVLGPLRSLYATVRDVPPDFNMALGHLRPLGVALKEYEDRFRGRDEGLANAFYAARGWLSGAYFEVQRRTGGARPMSDADIAERVQNVLDDLKGVQDRLR